MRHAAFVLYKILSYGDNNTGHCKLCKVTPLLRHTYNIHAALAGYYFEPSDLNKFSIHRCSIRQVCATSGLLEPAAVSPVVHPVSVDSTYKFSDGRGPRRMTV